MVGEISKKVQESMLKWYRHVLRRDEDYVAKRVMAMEVPRKEGLEDGSGGGWITRGTTCRRDNKLLSSGEGQDRLKWSRLIKNIDPT